MKLRWRLEVGLASAVFRFFGLWSGAGRIMCGRLFGFLGRILVAKVRKRTRANLRIAFPEASEARIDQLMRDAYCSIAKGSYDFYWSGRWTKEEVESRIQWEPESLRAFESAYRAGKGIVLVVGHLGNWEFVSHAIMLRGMQLNAYAAIQVNTLANEMVEKIRKRFGAKFFAPRMMNSPDMLRCLKKGEIAGFVADQNAGSRGFFVPFMGQLASTHKGPASYAALSGSEAFFGVGLDQGQGVYRIEMIPLGRCGRSESEILAFTARWVDILEKYIRMYPEQYFWMHNRWKSRPGPDSIIVERAKSDLQPREKNAVGVERKP